jgi:hypothetical protein
VLTGTPDAYQTLAHSAIIHRGMRSALSDRRAGILPRLAW